MGNRKGNKSDSRITAGPDRAARIYKSGVSNAGPAPPHTAVYARTGCLREDTVWRETLSQVTDWSGWLAEGESGENTKTLIAYLNILGYSYRLIRAAVINKNHFKSFVCWRQCRDDLVEQINEVLFFIVERDDYG